MPRKAAVTSLAGAEDTAPRRSTRIASQPQTEVKSTRKSRTTKKRTADDAIEEGAGEEESEVGKGKTKKVGYSSLLLNFPFFQWWIDDACMYIRSKRMIPLRTMPKEMVTMTPPLPSKHLPPSILGTLCLVLFWRMRRRRMFRLRTSPMNRVLLFFSCRKLIHVCSFYCCSLLPRCSFKCQVLTVSFFRSFSWMHKSSVRFSWYILWLWGGWLYSLLLKRGFAKCSKQVAN